MPERDLPVRLKSGKEKMLYACRIDKIVGFLKVRRISTKKGRLVRPEGEGEAYIYLLREDLSLREHIMIMLMIAASRAITTPDTTRVASFDS